MKLQSLFVSQKFRKLFLNLVSVLRSCMFAKFVIKLLNTIVVSTVIRTPVVATTTMMINLNATFAVNPLQERTP